MTDNRNYGVPDEIAEKLIRRGRDLGYAARKDEEATNAQWLADKQRATADPWAQHGPGWCPPEVHTGHLPGVVCPPGCTARKGEEATNVQWLADKQRATVDPLLAWLARGQAAQKAADEIIAAHSADSVAKDIEGRIHLLLPYKARMACGRKIGEHWDSALNHESVNCPDCLITIRDGDGDDVHPADNPYNCPCGREGES